jgi:tetratricopeptide (TPR) repeat protein
MSNFTNTIFLLFIILLTGCGITGRVAEMQAEAETAMEKDDYLTAFNYYEDIIGLKRERNRQISGITYHNAGISAWEIDRTTEAIEYLSEAVRKNYTTERGLLILSSAYREIDNLSLEITSLERYVENYPEGEHIDETRTRLFETYLESRNYESAMDLWPQLEQMAETDPSLLEGYLVLRENLGYNEELRGIATRLLKLDENNIKALEHLAEHYFWKAENRYQEEMSAYEKNRTARQYRHLLDALEEINREFRLSRDYFIRLWQKDPAQKYATYLRNIYIRFGDEEKADYYDKRIN